MILVGLFQFCVCRQAQILLMQQLLSLAGAGGATTCSKNADDKKCTWQIKLRRARFEWIC